MPERIRVYVIGDTLEEARRLSETFPRSSGFAVSGIGSASDYSESDPSRSDVIVVKVSRVVAATVAKTFTATFARHRATSRSGIRVPVLWVGDSSRIWATRREDGEAMLPGDATPAQIRAATAALAAGLRLGPAL